MLSQYYEERYALDPEVGGSVIGKRFDSGLRSLVGPGGFEPPFADPKSAVLPLDEGPVAEN